MVKNTAVLKSGLRIAITCGTRDDGHLPTVRDFDAALLAADIGHTSLEVEGLVHERHKLVTMHRTTWFDYHAQPFWRAAK